MISQNPARARAGTDFGSDVRSCKHGGALRVYRAKNGAGLYQLRIFSDRFSYDILHMVANMAFGVLIKLIRIDRLPVFDDDMRLFDLRDMVFEDRRSIIQGDRYDRTSALGGDLERTVLERKHGQLFTCISRALREDTDRDPIFNVVHRLKDGLEPLLWILPVKEEAVKALHPCRQREITLHLFFGDIACQSFASAVGQQDVEITPVVSYKKDRLIRDIFLSDHGSRHPGKPEDDAECPLHDAQGADIPGMGIEFPDDPFHDKDGNGESQIKEKKNCDTYKSKHRITLFLRYDHGAECLSYYTIAVWKKQDNRHKF